MNYDDYYARQVGGALPYFTGAHVGARVWKFVQRSPPIRSPSDQTRCCCIGEACADDWSTDCWRCRGWSECQEGDKTKGNGCRKRPDGKPPQHTTTSRYTNQAYKTGRPPSTCHFQQTTTTIRRVLIIWHAYTNNRVRG